MERGITNIEYVHKPFIQNHSNMKKCIDHLSCTPAQIIYKS